MTRLDFFIALRQGLAKLPQEEMESAVRYYTEYFDDAGEENEQRVLHELGDPAVIARQILAEYMVRDIVDVPPSVKKEPKRKKGISAVWVAVMAVFAAPIALPLAIAIAAVALSMVIVAAALFFSLFAAAVALMAAGLIAFFVGCGGLTTYLPGGLFAIGMGLAFCGIGLLLFLPTLWLTRVTFGGIARFISNRFVKKGASS